MLTKIVNVWLIHCESNFIINNIHNENLFVPILKRVHIVFSLRFYKTAGNTRVLTMAGTGDTMCGDTMKLLFKFRAKAYARKGTIYSRTCCFSLWIISLFIKTFGWFKVHSVTNNIVNNLVVTAM